MTTTRRKAFTVVELLVVMAVIAVLLSLVVVAVSAATRTGQSANTRHLMAAIKQGLARFKADVGYLPPVLGHRGLMSGGQSVPYDDVTHANHDLRRLFDPRGGDRQWGNSSIDDILPDHPSAGGPFTPNTNYANNVQEWYSVTTLAEYLVGYGHHRQDGYGFVPPPLGPSNEDEKPPLGIRHPDADGVWGGTLYPGVGDADGSLGDRLQGTSPAYDAGPVYGPYIDLKDDRLLASTDGTIDSDKKLIVRFPGEGGYDDRLPKVLCDYWGNPIRYYRRLYAPGALLNEYRPAPVPAGTPPVKPPTLADVFLLRPFKFSPGGVIDGIADYAGDTSVTTTLRSAEFALFSAGPDGFLNPFIRYDDPKAPGNTQGPGDRPTIFFNEDNIVETGP